MYGAVVIFMVKGKKLVLGYLLVNKEWPPLHCQIASTRRLLNQSTNNQHLGYFLKKCYYCVVLCMFDRKTPVSQSFYIKRTHD